MTLEGAAQFGKANIVDSKGKAVKYSVNKNFSGTAKNDNFTNYLDSAKITAGKGDDYIYNYGAKVSINAGDGSDRIYNQLNTIWNVATDTDETLGSPDNTTINAGKGNDFIYNDGSNSQVTINGGEGNDEIINNGTKVTINAGAGNDSIRNRGANVTIRGGKGLGRRRQGRYLRLRRQRHAHA